MRCLPEGGGRQRFDLTCFGIELVTDLALESRCGTRAGEAETQGLPAQAAAEPGGRDRDGRREKTSR